MTVPNVALPAPGKPITGGMEKDEFQELCSILLLLVGEREGNAGFLDQTKRPELAVLAVTVLGLSHAATTSFGTPVP